MKKSREKIIATTMAILMIISIASIFAPTVKATTVGAVGNTPTTTPGYPTQITTAPPAGVTPGSTFETGAYLSFRPNPIGVGQPLLVNVWLSPGTYHAFPMIGMTVDMIKPDGTTQSVGPFNSYVGDSTAWFEVIPDQVGTWQFKFTFAGTYIPAGQYWDAPGSEVGGFIASSKYYNLGSSIYYTPESTDWQNLTVQQNIVSSWPATPASFLSDYWTRPVNPMWRDTGMSIGDYPFSTVYYYPGGRILYPNNYKFTAYVTAPNTAHVLWKRTLDTAGPAGMVGGYTYDYSLAPGAGTPSIIYAGRCYQGVTKIFENGTKGSVFQCYDLRTGQIYWERPVATTTSNFFGFIMTSALTPQYIEYLPPGTTSLPSGASIARDTNADAGWQIALIAISGSQLYKWDPATGDMTGNYSLGPISGGTYYMPGYALSVQTLGTFTNPIYRLINWTTFGSSNNFADRVANNISWTRSSLTGGMGGCFDAASMLAASVAWNTPPGPQWGVGTEIIMTDVLTGKDLWHYQTNDTVTGNIQSTSSPMINDGILAFNAHGRHWVAFNARTGTKLWDSQQTEYPWGAWWPYSCSSMDINETCHAIITETYEGVYAINWADGSILWHYSTESFAVPFEGPYNAEPFFTGCIQADGKVYTYNGEHTASFPRDREWSIYCINGTTGAELWKMHNPMVPGAVADGYLTAANPYDGYMYVFGKGQISTTVTASPKTPAQGAQVLIEGTVMDQSPAQANTPCVSKDSMNLEMDHIHLGMQITGLWNNESINGVPVILTAIASDGTVSDLGSTTTNGYYGTFGMSWTPPKEGIYTIIATFAGDDSYGSSSTATLVSVGPAAASATPAPSVTQGPTGYATASDLATYMVGGVIAIIIAIAIVGVLMMRKR